VLACWAGGREVMMRIKGVLFALMMMVVVAGAMASSAVALPDISVTLTGEPLACYEVSNFKELERAGNWKNAACTEEVSKLTGKWVLATVLFPLKGTTNLWCAKLTPYTAGTNSATGTFSDPHCTTAASDGEYVDVNVPGNGYPLHLEITLLEIKTRLEGVSGSLLNGEGLLLLFLTSELTALGTFEALFLKVEETTTNALCHSTGDKEGEVLTSGSFHLVYTTLSPLRLGELFLPHEVEITCGKVVTKVKGDLLGSVKLGTALSEEEEDLTELGGVLSGTNGKQSIKFFYNDTPESVEAKLLSSVSGAVFKESNEVVVGEVKTKALAGRMFRVTSR
jgi:hypothetical protein